MNGKNTIRDIEGIEIRFSFHTSIVIPLGLLPLLLLDPFTSLLRPGSGITPTLEYGMLKGPKKQGLVKPQVALMNL